MSTTVNIDLTNFKDRVGSRVPPGTYRVIVEDAELDKSKAGNTMINLWFNVQTGENKGATIVDRLVLSEKSMFRVVGFMQALGFPTPKKKLQVDLKRFVNQTLDIEVRDGEPYNGRIKSEVAGYARVRKAEKQSEADLPEEAADDLPTEDAAEEAHTGAEGVDGPQSAPAARDDESDSQGAVDLDDLRDL